MISLVLPCRLRFIVVFFFFNYSVLFLYTCIGIPQFNIIYKKGSIDFRNNSLELLQITTLNFNNSQWLRSIILITNVRIFLVLHSESDKKNKNCAFLVKNDLFFQFFIVFVPCLSLKDFNFLLYDVQSFLGFFLFNFIFFHVLFFFMALFSID